MKEQPEGGATGAAMPVRLAEQANSLHYLLLLGMFLATRLALYAFGLRFHLDLAWMFLSDPEALRERLFETVFYFHAFAPGMNVITGLLLKLNPEHLALCANLLFWGSGYLLLASAFRLLQLLGCSRWAATACAFWLSLVPQSLYLEHLYLYTHLCASLVCWAAVAFHQALTLGKARRWFGFFLACAVLGWLYTAFHLFWFLLTAALSVAFAGRGRRRSVLLGGAAPLLLLFGLYLKNYVVFGVFGATSWGGANVALATTHRMPVEERQSLIDDGLLSPFAAVSVFAGPSEYLPLLPPDLHFPWPTTNELSRPSLDQPNFNHGLYLEVNRARGKDAAFVIRNQPGEYLNTVLHENLPGMFSPTTHWHKLDDRPGSPHYEHRRVLGRYERLYDRLVHGWPRKPYGLYIFLPVFCVWALLEVWRGLRSGASAERAQALLLGFCLLQIAFIVSISSLFSSIESARYRYTVEPFIWAVVAVGLRDAARWCGPRVRLLLQRAAAKGSLGAAAASDR